MKELVQPYEVRRLAVARFLALVNPHVEQRLSAIDDAFGPSIVDPRLQTIVVSEETISGGVAVNEKRGSSSLSQLSVLAIDCFDRHNPHGPKSINEKISSTARRKAAAASKV